MTSRPSPATPPRRTMGPADACVLLSVRGIPSWGAILVALVCGAIAIVAARSDGAYDVNWIFGAIFAAGIALAALAVRRGSIFTAMVQAPIVLAIVVLGTFKLLASSGNIASASALVESFPMMAVATGVGLLLGLVRIIAQPAHGHSAYSRQDAYHDHPDHDGGYDGGYEDGYLPRGEQAQV